MASNVRILYLAPCWPKEKSFGTQLRTSQVFAALEEVGDVECVVVAHADQNTHSSEKPRSSLPPFIELQPIDKRSFSERLRCKIDPRYMEYYGYRVGQKDRNAILAALSHYDLVWIHNLRSANVFSQWQWPNSVLDIDDVPSSYLQNVKESGDTLRERLRARTQLPVAHRREALLSERFTVLSVCSERDRRMLGSSDRIHVIPNGFPKPAISPVRRVATPPRIGFIGVFDYAPNAAGIQWFAKECWPLIRQSIPDATLRLAGNGSDGPAAPRGPGIEGLGWVDDASTEIATWSVMIVPVKLGAGTRIKIAEGFSRKCPIVSTSVGAYGYEPVDGREMFLADSAGDFARACIKAIQNPQASAAMADRAWDRFIEKWTWDAIRPQVHATAEDCLRRRSPNPPL